MTRGKFKYRQIRTSILLILLIIGIIAAARYFGAEPVKPTAAPIATYERDINAALERYRSQTDWQMADVHDTAASTVAHKAEVVLCGLTDAETMTQIVELLNKNAINPSFFFSTSELNANKNALAVLNKANYRVGILGDGSSLDVANASGEDIVSNLTRASLTMQSTYGRQPSDMLVYQQPTETLRYAAYSAYISTIYVADHVIRATAIKTEEEAEQAVADVPYGSVLCIQLPSRGANRISQLDWLFSSISKTDYSSEAKTLSAKVEAEPVEAKKSIYTTERAVAFTFAGLGSSDELTGVLTALSSLGGKGTFFVTKDDLSTMKDDVLRIIDGGHDLGIAVQTGGLTSSEAILQEILLTQDIIKSEFGYTKDLLLRPLYGSASQLLLKAAASGGFTVISSGLSMAQDDVLRETDAQTVLEQVLPASKGTLQRGEIVHFQMKQYQQSSAMLGELVTLLATERTSYTLRSVLDIMNNAEYTYAYPLAEKDILPSVLNKIHPGQLSSKTNSFSQIQKRYIGIDWVDRSSFLPGFTKEEIRKLDRKGLVTNSQNMVFLTFDDWGTDENITHLLDVLKSHNATATFFIRTSVVEANPNLLRAIALDGHAVGSHTDSHFPLSNLDGNGKSYSELTDEQVTTLKADLVTSYTKLQSIIGDIEIDGQPALCRIFRPPTLAVGYKGLEAVLDCGFTYSISGNYTSEDYKATSAEKLATSLKRNTKSGAVIIMHMSDNSIYTAEALDIYLTEMEQKTSGERYIFCRLTDALSSASK